MEGTDQAPEFARWVETWHLEGRLELELIQAVEQLLRSELETRNMLDCPPTFLGVRDFNSWRDPDALRFLTLDALEEVLIRRAASLYARSQVYPDIKGYFRLNVSRFVSLRHREADPAGYAVYQNVKALLRSWGALEHMPVGATEALRPGGRARVVLGKTKGPLGPPCGPTELESHMRAYPQWPEPARFTGQSVGFGAQDTLRKVLVYSTRAGLGTFRPRHLVRIFQLIARRFRPDSHARMLGEVPDTDACTSNPAVPTSQQRFEHAHDFAILRARLRSKIENAPIQDRKKLATLQAFDLIVAAIENGDPTPTVSSLAKSLQVPKSTAHGYLVVIRQAAEKCALEGVGR